MNADEYLAEAIAEIERARDILAQPQSPAHLAQAVMLLRLSKEMVSEGVRKMNKVRVAWNRELSKHGPFGDAARVTYLKIKAPK